MRRTEWRDLRYRLLKHGLVFRRETRNRNDGIDWDLCAHPYLLLP